MASVGSPTSNTWPTAGVEPWPAHAAARAKDVSSPTKIGAASSSLSTIERLGPNSRTSAPTESPSAHGVAGPVPARWTRSDTLSSAQA